MLYQVILHIIIAAKIFPQLNCVCDFSTGVELSGGEHFCTITSKDFLRGSF